MVRQPALPGRSRQALVERPDGLVYCVYYEKGKGSSIRGVRLRVETRVVRMVRNSSERN